MRWAYTATALVALLGSASPASAQFFPGRCNFGFASAAGFKFHIQNANSFFSAQFAFAQRFRLVQSGFGFCGPGFGGFCGSCFVPPVFVQPVPVALVQPFVVAPVDPLLPVGVNQDDFIVIRPRDQQQQPQQPAVAAQERPRRPAAPRPPPRREVELGVRPAPLPVEPPPAANPRVEAGRQVQNGRDAFAEGQFGRAIERFERAIAITPDEPMSYFLLAQARFTLEKYHEAVEAIAQGMKRRPNWPGTRFQSRELYGDNPAWYDQHLQALRKAVEAFPDDAGLLFLLGYELWFDGQRAEAAKIFQKAASRTTDPALIEAFLAEADKVVRR